MIKVSYLALVLGLMVSMGAHAYGKYENYRKGSRSDARERDVREQANFQDQLQRCLENGKSRTECLELLIGLEERQQDQVRPIERVEAQETGATS